MQFLYLCNEPTVSENKIEGEIGHYFKKWAFPASFSFFRPFKTILQKKVDSDGFEQFRWIRK